MRYIITSALSILTFISCANSTNTTKEETPKSQTVITDSTEKAALQLIFHKINKRSKASLNNDKILIGNSSISVKIEVEAEEQNEGKWIYAASFITSYINTTETQIQIGSIGIGSTRDEAIKICIQEWFGLFGIAFTSMLNGENDTSVSNMKVYPGLMGIRGQLPKNAWPKGEGSLTKKIIPQIEPLIKNNAGLIVPIDIKLKIGKNGIIDGECRVNNEVSVEVLNSLRNLSWPSSEEGFLFKQFYLVESL